MTNPLIKKTIEYVKKKLATEIGGHDWYHTERVLKMATQLQALEGGNLQIIQLAALLHDVGNYRDGNFNEKKWALVIKATMDILEIEPLIQQRILEIIEEAQFNGADTIVPSTIEGKIFQDAEWLDCLGAIGIARVFAEGARFKRVIYDPKRKVRHNLTKRDFQHHKQEGTSLHYFYEKSLHLPGLMNTGAARAIAAQRAEYIRHFVAEFLAEWKGEK